jgi:hypothetical protein
LPDIELDDISDDPEEAKTILQNYVEKLPLYMQAQQDEPMFPKRDEWEVPLISPELRIFGRRIDNTKPQVVDAIRRVAMYEAPQDAITQKQNMWKAMGGNPQK